MARILVPGFGYLSLSQERDLSRILTSGMSRREILGSLVAAGLMTTTAGGVLLSATTARAQTPVRGGHLRVAGGASSNAETIDPAKSSSGNDYSRGHFFYNGLTYVDPSFAAQPRLATEWSQDGTNTVWVFKIREGVSFHDGFPLTAADVVYSLRRHLDPEVGSRAKTIADQFADVTASGSHEVTITLVGPNGDLPILLGTPHFMIVKDGTTDFASANGTGPFIQKEFTPGVRVIGERNPNYWNEGQPYLNSVEFFGISEENARLNALIAGDVQLTAVINARSMPQIEANPEIALFETKSGTYSNLIMRQDGPPMNNRDFVLGMKFLLERETARRSIFRDFAVLGNDHPIDPSNPFHNADIPQREFDPERARFHFDKAGVIGTPIPVVVSEAARASIEIGSMMQEAGREIGVQIELQRAPSDGYWSNVWLKAPIHFGTISARPTADLLMSLLYLSDAAWNEAGWNNPQFDQLVIAARAETDFDKRKQMYGDMQVMIHEEGGTAIPLFFSNLDAYNVRLKGLVPNPTGNLMGYHFAENVWLEG